MIFCKNCINWIDENLEEMTPDDVQTCHIYMGCRILGDLEGNYQRSNCKYYKESENLFIICNSCGITVPKVCISLGECVNCTDTDLFCIDGCIGGENRKYCTHFVRLHTEGIQLIEDNHVFDLYPNQPMPGKKTDRKPKV